VQCIFLGLGLPLQSFGGAVTVTQSSLICRLVVSHEAWCFEDSYYALHEVLCVSLSSISLYMDVFLVRFLLVLSVS